MQLSTLLRHRLQKPSHTQGLSQTRARASVGQSAMCCNFFLADGFGFWKLDHEKANTMPPSQLKQLKAQLREQRGTKRKRPEVKETTQERSQKLRAQTLLPELSRRHKSGGIVDRRIGENDPRLAPEERMLQRFTREANRSKKSSLFNLEDGEEELLTHGGRSLTGDGAIFDGNFSDLDDDSVDEDATGANMQPLQRARHMQTEDAEATGQEADGPAVKKSRKEVMQEVMAKSKMFKAARQQAKEEDDDVREALDKDLPNLLAALRGEVKHVEAVGAGMHPDRLAQLGGSGAADKTYDQSLRQMAMDKRAQPSERTKTEEEKAAAEAERLKQLEQQRLRRMRGEEDSDDEPITQPISHPEGDQDIEDDEENDEAAEFGLSTQPQSKSNVLDVEDEDDFIIDEDLVGSGSDVDEDALSLEDGDASVSEDDDDDSEDDFLKDVLPQGVASKEQSSAAKSAPSKTLAYTYPCPQTHAELVKVLESVSFEEISTVIQRIRALYHPQLQAENKQKMENFCVALVDHVSYLSTLHPPLSVVEGIIRHIHSLSRTFAEGIARAFRSHLSSMHSRSNLNAGDLVLLSAIGSIYPTSDHFHQVVTPAITIIGRWLSIFAVKTAPESLTGAFLVALCIKYQKLAKRYIPEAVRFVKHILETDLPAEIRRVHTTNLAGLMDIWVDKPAFVEVFAPLLPLLNDKDVVKRKLNIMINQSNLKRRPMEHHHHRPLPIKTSIPKFEETFNPEKHYDPDRERSDASKLRAEYKRERKGALRELRKDAHFLATTKLKEKKEADKAYETKQRRLIAEIQGEEGKEKNAYEREKRARKGRK